MAEIKDFNRNQYLLKGGKDKNNKEKESDSDKKSMDNTLARYRQVKLYSVLSVLALAAVVVVGSYINNKNKVYIDYEVIQQNEWVRSSEAKSMNLKGTLFTYSNDGMNCTDLRGKTIWNQTYDRDSGDHTADPGFLCVRQRGGSGCSGRLDSHVDLSVQWRYRGIVCRF